MIHDKDKLFRFTRDLIDINSTTESEGPAARFVADYLASAAAGALQVELWPVEAGEPGRFNVFARHGHPDVVLSTHLDTVPPYIASREDGECIFGRGACDAKGIIAAQVFAALELLDQGADNFGLLFVVGEERNSAGAMSANLRPQGSHFLVNGEPTESRIIVAGKGALRIDLRARGRAAHSAYPQLGDSAIDKLLSALDRIRDLDLPHDPTLGTTTINIGTLSGGRAPNVIADEARAELLVRLVAPAERLRQQVQQAVEGLAEAEFVLEIPPIRLRTVPDFPTGIVAFGTDIPKLDAWGEPLLFGPGSIQVAHTEGEYIRKDELVDAVDAYARLVLLLQKGCITAA